jgi:hypothetical protein
METGGIDVAPSSTSQIVENLEADLNVIKDYSGQRTYLMLNTAVARRTRATRS